MIGYINPYDDRYECPTCGRYVDGLDAGHAPGCERYHSPRLCKRTPEQVERAKELLDEMFARLRAERQTPEHQARIRAEHRLTEFQKRYGDLPTWYLELRRKSEEEER
jgi:hypothetical protein